MNRQSSPRQLNYSHALLIAGLLLSLLVVMFRPAGAEAVLPGGIDVFETSDTDKSPQTVNGRDMQDQEITADYNVILTGKSKGTTVKLTGVPLIKYLEKIGAKTDGVQFIKIRYGLTDADGISLITLDPSNTTRPAMVLSSGNRPGRGPFPTPAIVPDQPVFSKAIREENIVRFKTGSGVEPIKFIPGKPGAKIMSVEIQGADKPKNGKYTLTARIARGGSSSQNKDYEWIGEDANGKPVKLSGTGKTIVIKDDKSDNAVRSVRVIVTQTGDGSTGADAVETEEIKKSKGTEKNPDPDPTPATTNNGSGGVNGTGSGVNGGSVNALPGGTQTNPGGTQTIVPPTPPTQPPTDSTGGVQSSDVDSAAITNVAQNVSGTGGLQTVTGVLLSSPTAAPAAEGGNSPITALPPAVANELNSIFQPVDDVDDAWVYLLALLFAFTFSGAVREWVKP